MARRCPNVLVLDATIVDASGVVVPRDIDNDDLDTVPQGYDFSEIDAYTLPSRSVKSDLVAKAINDANTEFDLTVGVTTADDASFEDWSNDDGPVTVETGTPPDNVEHGHIETVAGHLGVKLVADPAPTTGTITVVFGSRLYGGA